MSYRILDGIKRIKVTDITLLITLCSIFVLREEGSAFDFLLRYGALVTFYLSVLAMHKGFGSCCGRREMTAWLIAFWCYAFLSAVWAMNRTIALARFGTALTCLTLPIFVLSLIENRSDVEKLLWLLIVANCYSMIMLALRTPTSDWGTERVGGAIGISPNAVGMRCAICSYLAMYLYRISRQKICLAVIIPFGLITVLTGSRKGLLLLLLLLATYLLISARGIQAIWRPLLVAVLLFASIRVVMTNPYAYEVAGARMERLINNVLYGAYDGSSMERAFYREQAMFIWKQKPVFGWGIDQFKAWIAAIGYSHVAYSHCNYTEMLANYGLIGFILWYSFYIYIAVNLYRMRKSRDFLATLSLILIVYLTVFEYGFVSYLDKTTYLYLIIAYGTICTTDRSLDRRSDTQSGALSTRYVGTARHGRESA